METSSITSHDSDARSGWARITIRIIGVDARDLELPKDIAHDVKLSRKNDIALWTVDRPDDTSLQDQIVEAHRLIAAHSSWLRSLMQYRIDLFVSWSPKAPSESLVLDRTLTKMIAEMNAAIMISTYTA